MKKVVIFAGHDHDTWEKLGAKGVRTDLEADGVYEEYDTNLLIAKGAVKILRTVPGLIVYFPQEDGRKMTLKQRVDYANKIGADLLIDIHSNAAASRTATGAAAFYWKGSTNSKRAADIYAGLLKKEGLPLWSNGTYASNVEDGWSAFYMLRYSNMPAILLENFFFTTRSDLQDYLLNESVQRILINAIAETAAAYLSLKLPTVIQASNPATGSAKPNTGKVESSMPISQNRPNRKKGDKAAEVGWIQRSLNRLGEKLIVDDIFGRDTEDALKRFQKKYGLETDGIYGNASRTRLEDVMRDLTQSAAKPAVVKSADKAIVIHSFIDYPAVQQLHKQTGYPIYERAALKGKIAGELIVAGGGKKGLEKYADRFTDLSGGTWAETVAKVAAYVKK